MMMRVGREGGRKKDIVLTGPTRWSRPESPYFRTLCGGVATCFSIREGLVAMAAGVRVRWFRDTC